MFNDAQPQIEKIVALVKLCPEKLQEKCFELLLTAYLQSLMAPRDPTPSAKPRAVSDAVATIAATISTNPVPEAIKTRFNSLVARTKVTSEKAAELFDFNVDPFNFHALSVPGASTREKMRSVALLLALKGYLTSANWVADWKEFRATCMDHSCWDQNNAVTTMKHEWFRTASMAANINLSPSGIKAAESSFAKLAGGADDAAA